MAGFMWLLSPESKPTLMKILSALFYAMSSFFIVVVNKVVLTTYKFPSFQVLGLGQMAAGIVIFFVSKQLSIITYPDFSRDVVQKIWPLPLFYLGNVICGLGGTQKLNLPMFTVLRRFSILFTMILEYFILNVHPSTKVQLSVGLMIVGSLIASSTDLAFDSMGYLLIMLNNLCTAGNGVYTKKKLDSKTLGRYGVIFYNSLFTILPVTGLAVLGDEFHKVLKYDNWLNPFFLTYFLMSCVMGFVLNYSIILCTAHNSALTTTVVGVFKNMLITYLGMIIGNDYIFSWPNFIGLNISVFGSLVYSYATFKPPAQKTSIESKTLNV